MTPPDGRCPAADERERGIVLAIVLVLIFVLITAVYAFQRRSIMDATIAQNRLAAAEADTLARGGLRIAEAVVFLLQLKEEAEASGDGSSDTEDSSKPGAKNLLPQGELWARLGEVPLEFEGGQALRVTVEDEGARLNLNALVPQAVPTEDDASGEDAPSVAADDEAVEYLTLVLHHIIVGMRDPSENRSYDERAIAENLIDYMDADPTAISGRNEDSYYLGQDPPYTARNGPLLSVDEIGLVEGIDPPLLEAMRDYVTVHPIGGRDGINMNRAAPWVLSLLYAGPSGERELARETTVRAIWKVRGQSKIVCEDVSADPQRCVSFDDAGIVEKGFYPQTSAPAKARVFRMVSEARVGNMTRTWEAIYDMRPLTGPQLLSWRRLRGPQ
jgi:type II secretory pathway component PulK